MCLIQTDYLFEAFGEFNENVDPDAAVKFCLNILAMDHSFPDLAELLRSDSKVGGIGGDPGWDLERRLRGHETAYEDWPADATFRAFVEPSEYELAFPEGYYTAGEFSAFVRAILKAYLARHPDQIGEADQVTRLLVT